MSGKYVDVRLVPYGKEWAVKVTGGPGNKPIVVTKNRDDALKHAIAASGRYQVPLLIYDANGTFVEQRDWPRDYKPGKL